HFLTGHTRWSAWRNEYHADECLRTKAGDRHFARPRLETKSDCANDFVGVVDARTLWRHNRRPRGHRRRADDENGACHPRAAGTEFEYRPYVHGHRYCGFCRCPQRTISGVAELARRTESRITRMTAAEKACLINP